MRSEALTVDQYLKALPDERRQAITIVRDCILKNLPVGYEESMNWGMISYEVPLSRYPDTYNKKPLLYVALGSQKEKMSIYLTAVYVKEQSRELFEKKYRATGKPFDAGKSCVRFKKLDDLPLELIAESIKSTSVDEFIRLVEEAQADHKNKKKR